MKRLVIFLFYVLSSCVALGCDCGAPGPACAWVANAEVIFVGTPVYTNDDRSGTFVQQTLYRFEVEEVFKGLPAGTKEVWVDPGSFTSCYAEYKLGTKLLVFARKRGGSLGDSAAMTVAAPGKKRKPLPPGFDPKMPVYYAPECSGTRGAEYAPAEITWLRSWKEGKTKTSIDGEVIDDYGSPLAGAKITVKDVSRSFSAQSGLDGRWRIESVPAGHYLVTAELQSYRLRWTPERDVVDRACAYVKLPLESSGSIAGTAVGPNQKPLADIEVTVSRYSADGELEVLKAPIQTRSDGSFVLENLPAGDFIVGVNVNFYPRVRMPYDTTYLPGVREIGKARVLHLNPGEKLRGLNLQMGPALPQRAVKVRVTWPDGRSAGKGVWITAKGSNADGEESVETDTRGFAVLKCLADRSYEVSANKWLSAPLRTPLRSVKQAVSGDKHVAPGARPISINLVLARTVKPYDHPDE
jgi:hypothetical protein